MMIEICGLLSISMTDEISYTYTSGLVSPKIVKGHCWEEMPRSRMLIRSVLRELEGKLAGGQGGPQQDNDALAESLQPDATCAEMSG